MKDSSKKSIRRLEKRDISQPFNMHRHLMLRKRQLQARATVAECAMKDKLLAAGFRHAKFQRGFMSDGVCYVADFFLKGKKIVLEIDGPSHLTAKAKAYDAKRDEYFRGRGFTVLRITNEDALAISVDMLRVWILSSVKPA